MNLADLQLSSTNNRILSYLVQNHADSEEFREWHLGHNRSILFDIMAYRAVKIERIMETMPATLFATSYQEGDAEQRHDLLQRLFQQWISDAEMDKLTQRIAKGLSPQMIYEQRRLRPNDFLTPLIRG